MSQNGLIGLRGFELVEVVRLRGGVSPPDYHHVEVAFSGAAVDEEGSFLERRRAVACERCRSDGIDAVHGFVIERGSWTGEDVFVARGLPGLVLVTRRFRRLVQDCGLTNVDIVATDTYDWDPRVPLPGRPQVEPD